MKRPGGVFVLSARPGGAFVVAALAALTVLAVNSGDAAAVPPPPRNLVVSNGGEAWRPDNGFDLRWQNPEQQAPLVTAIHYRVRNPGGSMIVGDTRLGEAVTQLSGLLVPNLPGAYTAEVWLEDADGGLGAPATVRLRFDNARPGDIQPLPKPGWIGRTDLPYALRVSQPAAPLPVSGIHGYALAVDRSPAGDPCARPDICADAETDLRGGLDDNALAVDELPEGRSYVHALAVSGSGVRSVLAGHAVLWVDRTDPVTALSGAPTGWANHAVFLTATASDALSGMRDDGEDADPFTAIRIDGGTPVTAAGDSVSAAVIEPGVHTVAYYARDAAGNVNDGGRSNGQDNRAPYFAAVRIDRAVPEVAFFNSQDPASPETIRARVGDSLAGPDGARGSIAVRPAGSGDRFQPLPTEAGPVLRAHWDSDSYPPGRYEFRATGYDAAGNTSVSAERANGSRMLLSSPLKTPTSLYAGLEAAAGRPCRHRPIPTSCRQAGRSRRAGELVVPQGRAAILSGRLVASGVPVADARVLVVQRYDPGAGLSESAIPIHTAADGTFKARLAPGPSREVSTVFPGGPTLTRSAGPTSRLEVNSGIRLRASASEATVGGRPVVFRGRLEADSAGITVRERTVQLQFRLPGLPWTEFRSLQTDAHGRYRFAYRFSDDDSRGASFKFRAFVPAQIGWPYRPAGSPPVTVHGR
ncbi:MAG TPA: hypothetical protein VFL89_06045 [Solirubrobacterales bacterium]|nr:hypothetical protein [Solirubrobacterales bacterium]